MIKLAQKIATSIEYIQQAADLAKAKLGKDLIFIFSCDKESRVLDALCKISGINYRAVYQSTGVDNPEIMSWLKSSYPHVSILTPPVSMPDMIRSHMSLPSRLDRYCSNFYHFSLCLGNGVIIGARSESYDMCVTAHAITSRGFNLVLGLANGTIKQSQVIQPSILYEDGPISDKTNDISPCVIARPLWSWSNSDMDKFISYFKIAQCSFKCQNLCCSKCVLCPLQLPETRRIHAYRYRHLIDKLYVPAIYTLMRMGMYPDYNSADDVLQAWIDDKIQRYPAQVLPPQSPEPSATMPRF